MADGSLAVWVCHDTGGITGTVGLAFSRKPNGRRRAEILKLIVHREARGQGIARALLATAEAAATAAGVTLLLLDTRTAAPPTGLRRRGLDPLRHRPGLRRRPGRLPGGLQLLLQTPHDADGVVNRSYGGRGTAYRGAVVIRQVQAGPGRFGQGQASSVRAGRVRTGPARGREGAGRDGPVQRVGR
ncbi:hypothetical protein SANTM175S_06664 [Streptomyces antimycoticus]